MKRFFQSIMNIQDIFVFLLQFHRRQVTQELASAASSDQGVLVPGGSVMNDVTVTLINYTQGFYIMKRQLKARQKRQEKHFVKLKVAINQVPLTKRLFYLLIQLRGFYGSGAKSKSIET